MLIDTHAHLVELNRILSSEGFEDLVSGLDEITSIISIGCTKEEIEQSALIAKKHKNIFYTAGYYPHKNQKENDNLSDIELIEALAGRLAKNDDKLVAIGECGLDFSQVGPSEHRSEKEQIELFEKQIELATKFKLPLSIHSRKATERTLEVLSRAKTTMDFTAVWHCFNEDKEISSQILDLGIKISLNGIITYKSAGDLIEAIEYMPLEQIMLETDSPFLVPEPLRSRGAKPNTPKYVKIVAEKVAEIKKISCEKVSQRTSQNAIEFFQLNLKDI